MESTTALTSLPVSNDRSEHLKTDGLMSDLTGRAARGGTIMVTSQGFKFFFNMASAVVLARLLTPQDYGLIAMVAVVTNFSYPFRNLGLSAATIQKPVIDNRQVSNLFWVNVGLSVAIMLLTMAFAPVVAWFYGEPRLIWITVAIAAGFIFSGLAIQHEALLKRQMRFFGLAASELGSMLAGTIAAIALAWWGVGVWALVGANLVTAFTFMTGVWIAYRWRPALPARNSGVRSMLKFGRNLTGNNVLNYLSRNIDNLLIGRVWGPRQLGLYARAYQLLLLPLDQLCAPIDGVAITALSRLTDDPERYRAAYLRMLEKLAMVTMPAMALMIGTSDWIVRVMLGPQWIETGKIFAILGILGLIEPISNTMGWLLISQGRTHHVLQWGVIDAVLSIASILVGLPWGAIGVATSYALTGVCLRKPLQFWFVTRTGPVLTRDFLKTIMASVFAAICVLAALRIFRSNVDFEKPFWGLVIGAAIAGVVSLLSFSILPSGRRALVDVRNLATILVKR
ncbi:MAG TPA: lipopolysaccharide biosynthesis protein [Pyrinomonadaceae bacterium]|jgi:O-antigen/teichoic acid export membrane protein|nr:lipopolysaccharide biosynthesis protein [Pyrinomonadaceae bacterium]